MRIHRAFSLQMFPTYYLHYIIHVCIEDRFFNALGLLYLCLEGHQDSSCVMIQCSVSHKEDIEYYEEDENCFLILEIVGS